VTPTRNYWTQTVRVCPPSGCTGSTGGAVCVPLRGCADGSVEQVLPDGLVGCAGSVTFDSRDALCAPGYRAAASLPWAIVNQYLSQITPTHDYWTGDYLLYSGTAPAIAVFRRFRASPPGPNQVVRASRRVLVRAVSDPRDKCPSRRINTAVGAATPPSTGSSQTPA
jgi:hypothetical protein